MAPDIEIIKQRYEGQAQGYGLAADPGPSIDTLDAFPIFITKASADAMASTTTSETYTGLIAVPKVRIVAAYMTVLATGITVDATNNATITINKRDSAAANKTAVATLVTNVATGNLVIGAPKAMTVSTTSGAFVVDALSGFTYEIAKGGTGVVVPASVFTLWLTKV
jgi:hypothetical protein